MSSGVCSQLSGSVEIRSPRPVLGPGPSSGVIPGEFNFGSHLLFTLLNFNLFYLTLYNFFQPPNLSSKIFLIHVVIQVKRRIPIWNSQKYQTNHLLCQRLEICLLRMRHQQNQPQGK